MRYFLIDYDAVKHRYYAFDGIHSLTEHDMVYMFFSDTKHSFRKFLKQHPTNAQIRAKSTGETLLSQTAELSFIAGVLCANAQNEIVIISDSSIYHTLVKGFTDKDFKKQVSVYPSMWHYFWHLWKTERRAVLDSLNLSPEQHQKLSRILGYASNIRRADHRCWKTHNRIQELFRNPEQCAEIYASVKPLLIDVDIWRW